jgi:hypothetical protein
LHVVDTSGVVSDVGALGEQSITGLIFGNTLYSLDGLNIYSYTVSPTSVSGVLSTTQITGLDTPNGDFVTALATVRVATVPEPASLVMVSMAIVAAGVLYARRYLASC